MKVESKIHGKGVTSHVVRMDKAGVIVVSRNSKVVNVDMSWEITNGDEVKRGRRTGLMFGKGERWVKQRHGGLDFKSEGCDQVVFECGSSLDLNIKLKEGEECIVALAVRRK
jgi:hypothetical protein